MDAITELLDDLFRLLGLDTTTLGGAEGGPMMWYSLAITVGLPVLLAGLCSPTLAPVHRRRILTAATLSGWILGLCAWAFLWLPSTPLDSGGLLIPVLCLMGFVILLKIGYEAISQPPAGASATATRVPAVSTNPPAGGVVHGDSSGRTSSTGRYIAPTATPAREGRIALVLSSEYPLSPDRATYEALMRATRDNDRATIMHGLTMVPNGTRIRILQTDMNLIRVEVTEGPERGRSGWLPARLVGS